MCWDELRLVSSMRIKDEGRERGTLSYLGEGAVVPEIALVGEAVADKSKLALLGVLLDGVEELILGDLREFYMVSTPKRD